MRMSFLHPMRVVFSRPLIILVASLILLGGVFQAVPLSAEEASPDLPAAAGAAAPEIQTTGGGDSGAVQSPDVVPPETGSFSVTIDGPKEAKWTFDGKTFDSGHVAENVPTGKYAVSFSDVPEWTKPADAEVTVEKDGAAALEGKYIRHMGSVSVTIDGPKEAKWTFDGKTFDSGHVVENVPTGKYAVSFADVPEWTKPADAEDTVEKDGAAALEGKYVRHVGSVSVTIDGPKDARWIFDGKGGNESGAVISNIPTGNYSVAFYDLPGWTKPDDLPVTVAKDIPTEVTGTYIRHVGSVSVTIDGPKEAKWTFDGKTFDSGSVAENVPTGKYAVSFSDAPEWTKPADAEVTVEKDGLASLEGKYVRHVGAVSVTIDGPAEAKWSFDGKTFDSGHVVENVPTGKYAVSFSDVPEWTKPADAEVTVEKDGAAALEGKYIRHVGSVSVTISGPKEAKWSFDGKTYDSGQAAENVPTGKYAVSFTDVPEWTRPSNASVAVVKDETAVVSAKYVRHVGAVSVKIDGPEGAKWRLDGKGPFGGGHILADVPTGTYTVSYEDVPEWTKPEDTVISVKKDETVSIPGSYVRHVGSVSVKIDGPEGVRWNFDGKGNYAGGHVLKDIPTGQYTVSFTEVPGWTKPSDVPVTVTKDGMASMDKKYVRHVGSVSVKIDGPEGARWNFDGKGDYAGGHVLKDIPTGQYTVSFTEVPDWTKPSDVPISVTRDKSVSVSGVYVKHTGSVSVTIQGPAEARWSLNGAGRFASGQTTGNIDVGNSVISFSDVPGWTRPANVRVAVRNGMVSRASGAYVRHTGSVRVDITGTKDGRWSLDGKGNYPSGWTAGKIVVGTYKVLFSNVSGSIKPEAKTITVKNGVTTTLSAAYTPNTGSVTVTIDGPKEARWSIDGRGSYQSGQTVGGVIQGNHTISFSYVKGWKSPADRKITVQRGATISSSGAYTER